VFVCVFVCTFDTGLIPRALLSTNLPALCAQTLGRAQSTSFFCTS
jgi:hypothetical protein